MLQRRCLKFDAGAVLRHDKVVDARRADCRAARPRRQGGRPGAQEAVVVARHVLLCPGCAAAAASLGALPRADIDRVRMDRGAWRPQRPCVATRPVLDATAAEFDRLEGGDACTAAQHQHSRQDIVRHAANAQQLYLSFKQRSWRVRHAQWLDETREVRALHSRLNAVHRSTDLSPEWRAL